MPFLDLGSWQADPLNNLIGEQKTISLANLLKLGLSKASLRNCVKAAAEKPVNAS